MRWLLVTALSMLALLAAWRIAIGVLADRMAASNPERALRWNPNHPIALLVKARRALTHGQPQASTALVRRLLAVEPLQGEGYGLIAATADSGDPTRASELNRIAVRRAPRETGARVWLINHYLQNARYAEALQQIDTLLRIAPAYRAQIYPALAQLADQPAFARELGRTLHARPGWRAGFLEMLETTGEPATSSRVLGAIQRSGGLEREELTRWIEGLIRRQRWSEAYSRWADALVLGNAPLRAVHNGDFATLPSSSGFDWRLLAIQGVELDFPHDAGTNGLAAHVYFPGRPAAKVNLEHPLLLAPGRYRLTARMRAQSLDGEYGLQWTVVCGDKSQTLANSEPVLGSFGWREIHTDFNIPAGGCPGQWLQLLNPAPGGAAQRLSGEVWFDDVSIRLLDNLAQAFAPAATLRVEQGAGMRSQGADFVSVKSGARMADGDRLMLTKDSMAVVIYDNGCTQKYTQAGVYQVRQSTCATAYTSQAIAGDVGHSTVSRTVAVRLESLPVIETLPNDQNHDVPPIGR